MGDEKVKKRIHCKQYNFWGDSETGLTLRWGETPHKNPPLAPWPELADISISNYCTKGCDFCYRDSDSNGAFLSLEDYCTILDQLTHPEFGAIFQVALGGGEPLEHPDFFKIIDATAERGIVANFTTNGIHMTEEIAQKLKGKIGAIALSASSVEGIDRSCLDTMIKAGIRTNIHFLLSNESIKTAIEILKGTYNDLLVGINGLIFLTYKPRGRAEVKNCLQENQEYYEFLSLIKMNKCSASVGFDACFIPPLLRYANINEDYVDSCECGFFSVYIDENMVVKPCSFSNNDKYSYSLQSNSFQTIWEKMLSSYRKDILGDPCTADCSHKGECRGACPYYSELSFCAEQKRGNIYA